MNTIIPMRAERRKRVWRAICCLVGITLLGFVVFPLYEKGVEKNLELITWAPVIAAISKLFAVKSVIVGVIIGLVQLFFLALVYIVLVGYFFKESLGAILIDLKITRAMKDVRKTTTAISPQAEPTFRIKSEH